MAKKKRRTELDIDMTMPPAEEARPPEPEPAQEEPVKEIAPPEEKPQAKINKIKLSMIISGALGLVSLLGALTLGAWVYFKAAPEKPAPPPKVEKKRAVPLVPKVRAVIPPLYEFSSFLVSVGKKNHQSLVKITFAAELSEDNVSDEIARNLVLIRENIFTLLKSKPLEEFRDEKKKRHLAVEVAIILNESIQSGAVVKVYITELVIQ